MTQKLRRALVTGGSRGIGRAIAERLRESEGYELFTPGRDQLNLCDLASIQRYTAENSAFDILINNAGINILSDLEMIDPQKIEAMVATNLLGPLYLIQGVVPHMKKEGWGRIINISSISGITSKARRTLYSMTKFGINGITKSLSKELGPHNILVNSVCPGYVNTALTAKNIPPAEREKLLAQIPLARFAEPSEISSCVEYLVSSKNTYITGQSIVIDGGFL